MVTRRGQVRFTGLASLALLALCSCGAADRTVPRLGKTVMEDPATGRAVGFQRPAPRASPLGPDRRAPRVRRGVDLAPAFQAVAGLTGVDPGFLRRTARAESGFRTCIRAPTGTAIGLFQVTTQTWLTTVHRHGAGLGLGRSADAVGLSSRGVAQVSDPVERARILGLRCDPLVAAAVAAALASDNRRALQSGLGRPVDAGELYLAHVLGAHQSLRLILAAKIDPALPADRLLPVEARHNLGLFYAGAQPRSVADLLGRLERQIQ